MPDGGICIPPVKLMASSNAEERFPKPSTGRRSSEKLWSDKALEDGLQLYSKLVELSTREGSFGRAVRSSLDILNASFRLYGPENVILSFNGGKDATVALHLTRAVLAHYYYEEERDSSTVCSSGSDRSDPTSSIRNGSQCDVVGTRKALTVIYFEDPSEFPEVTKFIGEMVEEYELDRRHYGCDFVAGMTDFLAREIQRRASYGSHMAIVLGTRIDDIANGQTQGPFEPSSVWLSSDWRPEYGRTKSQALPSSGRNACPPFMRVNPVLYWKYGDIWNFLLDLKIPYCGLYDKGYTSLGNMSNTVPNPSLYCRDTDTYSPAHKLKDWALERGGR